MNATRFAVHHRSTTLAVVFVALVLGYQTFDPLETAIGQMSEVDEITSQSKTGMSVITVELQETLGEGAVDQAWDVLRNKVAEARGSLPDGCGTPWERLRWSTPASPTAGPSGFTPGPRWA